MDRAAGLVREFGTAVLGITGAPGAGKSTLAEWLVPRLRERLGDDAVAHAPMDGFHLADVELRRLHRVDRKGDPDTFDLAGFAALLRRVREHRTETVYAPTFERDLEQPLAAAVTVPASAQVVITEGNYLLLDEPEWRAVADALDETWFVETDDAVRRERLVERHVRFGKAPDEARTWVETVDQPNAELVAATRSRADLVIRLA